MVTSMSVGRKVNVQRLVGNYISKPQSKAVIDKLASMKDRAVTTVDGLEGAGRKRQDIIDTLHLFEEAGCGIFYAGRRNKPTRFEWSVSMSDSAKFVQTQAKEMIAEERGAEKPEEEEAEAEHPAPKLPIRTMAQALGEEPEIAAASETVETGGGKATYQLPLRPGITIRLELPLNLSQADAELVATKVTEFVYDHAA